MGGTKIAFGLMIGGQLLGEVHEIAVPAEAGQQELLKMITTAIEGLIDDEVSAIGIGVPGLVDKTTGEVYDLLNVPAWDRVALGPHLQARYQLPVSIDNDANCFALAEYHYGLHGASDLVGITIGTGLGAGIIAGGKLVTGTNGGAGEFGMIPYLDHFIEYYACGQFFEHVHKVKGEEVYAWAQAGDHRALDIYRQLGHHLGHALSVVRLAVDPELIVLGGSVANGFAYFEEAMWERLAQHPFPSAMKAIKIKTSQLNHAPLLGAGSLGQSA